MELRAAKIIEIENRLGALSTFFVMGSEENYSLNDTFMEVLNLILSYEREIGLHGGFSSYNSLEKILTEKKNIEQIMGSKLLGYRNHYLNFIIPTTWKLLKRAGFKYDSTFGYNDSIGFRNGLPFPFRPFDPFEDTTIEILEISLNLMDVTLFDYCDIHKISECLLRLESIISTVKKYHGVLTINFHNDKFNETLYPGVSRLYERLLTFLKDQGGWLTDGRSIYTWWRKSGYY